jgi:hypothetical protein
MKKRDVGNVFVSGLYKKSTRKSSHLKKKNDRFRQ